MIRVSRAVPPCHTPRRGDRPHSHPPQASYRTKKKKKKKREEAAATPSCRTCPSPTRRSSLPHLRGDRRRRWPPPRGKAFPKGILRLGPDHHLAKGERTSRPERSFLPLPPHPFLLRFFPLLHLLSPRVSHPSPRLCCSPLSRPPLPWQRCGGKSGSTMRNGWCLPCGDSSVKPRRNEKDRQRLVDEIPARRRRMRMSGRSARGRRRTSESPERFLPPPPLPSLLGCLHFLLPFLRSHTCPSREPHTIHFSFLRMTIPGRPPCPTTHIALWKVAFPFYQGGPCQ